MPQNMPTSDSTASLTSNTYTVSSTVPLNSHQPPKKDYAAALGDLQSRYGAAISHSPTFTPVIQKQAKDSSQSSSNKNGANDSGSSGALDNVTSRSQPRAEGTKKKRFSLFRKGK
ncbi:hypothetical protein D9757_008899 [Collybiopsis confluens]|uniref:Uncharacterized protein n=1 Tax=Collybiopsis confluens TaxID=2823264 RepID=A0A8H5H5A2_9AGAR|nr:hypothetical protein D9757_008899 [Collybiopsis confluens]